MADTERPDPIVRVRARINVEELGYGRRSIATTVVASSIEELKRKAIGVISLMEEGDLEGGS